MPSLREIKDRIGSVRSTLKITSAMKLVASAKLRKAQRTIETLRPYEEALSSILLSLAVRENSPLDTHVHPRTCQREGPAGYKLSRSDDAGDSGRDGVKRSGTEGVPGESCSRLLATAIIVISSNSSLCGGFNANVIRKAGEVIRQEEAEGRKVKVFAIGRRVADALKKSGYESEADYSETIAHPSYDTSARLSGEIIRRFDEGEFGKVLLVYNHFVTAATQSQVVEQYLPYVASAPSDVAAEQEVDYIVEPSAEEVLQSLLPQVMTLKFHAAVLDSAAAEHAARTVAMQAATDNAEDLLSELTLEYNKGRQQKITAEILDLLGGSAE